MAHPIEGLVTAVHTPMHADGGLNLDMIEKLAETQIGAGVRGVFVCGTAGEGQSLTVTERQQVLERWREVAGDDLLVVAHVGSNCLSDARVLATHAQQTGADAVASMAPSFSAPRRAEELVAFCAEIAAAAPDTPFYYYHLPSRTHVTVAAASFLEMAADRIPNLGGLKFTDNDLTDFGRCIALAGDRFTVLFGRTETLLAGLTLGAHGSIGGPYNSAAPLFQRLYAAHRSGDLATAQAEQARARELGVLTKRSGGLPALKATMKMIGLDCGPVRLPLRSLSAEEVGTLRTELEGLGFFDYCIGGDK